jgi:hypothetical protein
MVKIAVLFFSTSRYEYLLPVLESFKKNVDFSGVEVYKIFIDDYPKNRDEIILDYIEKTYKIDNMVLNEKNLGYSVSWGKAWSLIPDDIDYIWHQEDDLEILDKVNVLEMITMLNNSPKKAYQICLKRNICYEADNDFVYQIENDKLGTEVTVNNGKEDVKMVLFQSHWFIPHATIYPKWVTELKYSFNPQEGILPPVIRAKYPDSYSALYGGKNDKYRLKHLGEYNQGQRMIEGEPGFENFGKYDKDKPYYSLKYFTEWKGSRNYEMVQLYKKYKDYLYNQNNYEQKLIEYLKKSILEDNDVDKRYISALSLAKKLPEDSLYYLNQASKINPDRLEVWYELMKNHTDHKQVAYGYGLQGYNSFEKWRNNGCLKVLEMDENIYNFKFVFDFCMVCFYANQKEKLYLYSELIDKQKTPDSIYQQHINNKVFYKPIVKIPKSRYKTPSLIVIDNFLEDPHKEREFALSQDFKVVGNFPGYRTESFATDQDKLAFETIMNKNITFWPAQYNGSYQYCTKDYRSWIHRDRTTSSAILYLTPNPPPNSGTKIYIHKETGGMFEHDNVNGILDKDSNNMNAWRELDVVENKFNRLVIFQGIQNHMSAEYFGDNKENGRLMKIYFFNVEDALHNV